MLKPSKVPKTIDQYIKSFPKDVQVPLKKIRETIKKAAPGSEEVISYQMPSFKLNGKYLLYFAAWKSHIGFYPTPSGRQAFKKELSKYKTSTGTAQFPLDKPLPVGLITKVVKYRVKEVGGNKIQGDLPSGLSAPAFRALSNAKITSLKALSKYSEKEIIKLHGMGPASIPILRSALKKKKLGFRK